MGAVEQTPDTRSRGEQIGEQFLTKLDAVQQGAFYSGPVIDYIYEHLPKEAKDPKLSKKEALQKAWPGWGRYWVGEVLSKNIITYKDVGKLIEALDVDLKKFLSDTSNIIDSYEYDAIIDAELSNIPRDAIYKPLGITAEVEESESIKQLVKEIEQSVGKRHPGVELEEDKETHVWKFAKRKKESKKEESKQEFSHLEEKDFNQEELKYKLYPLKYTVCFSGKGIFYVAYNSDGEFLVLPNGEKTSVYNGGIDEVIPLRESVLFRANDGSRRNSFAISRYFGLDHETKSDNPSKLLRIIKKNSTDSSFLFKEGNKEFISSILDFRSSNSFHKYDKIKETYVFKGELYYVAREGNKEFLVFPDGKEGPYFDNINWIGEVNGELYYEAGYKDKEINEDGFGERYFIDGNNNKILEHNFFATDLGKIRDHFFYGLVGMVVVDSYVTGPKEADQSMGVRDLKNFNNKIGCIVEMEEGELFTLQSSNSWISSPKYKHISKLLNIDGKSYYLAEDEKRNFFIVDLNGKEMRDFGNVRKFEIADGFVHVLAEKDGKWIHYYVEVDKFVNGKKDTIQEKESEEPKDLTEEELRRVALLNAISTKNKERVTTYREKYIDPVEKAKENELYISDVSRGFVGNLNQMFKGGEKALLNTVAAKNETIREAKMLAEYLFPEPLEEYSHTDESFGRYDSSNRVENFLKLSGGESQFGGGDPMEKGQEVMRTREKINELIVTNIVAKYNKQSGTFEDAVVPISSELDEPTREYTFSIPDIHGLQEVSLPFLLGAEIIPERVKGITEDGSEIPLSVDILPTGGAHVSLPPKIKSIAYSLRRSELPVVPEILTERDYNVFQKDLSRQHGTKFSGNIALLPSEIKLFASSLEKLSLQEKIIAIEKEVRRIGYYDFENGEVKGEKNDMKLDELFSYMRERMDELKKRKQDMPENFKDKMFAGVCVDFNKLVLAMMREAGIPSGLLSGFYPHDEIVTTANAHATAFAMWPGKKSGTCRIIQVDGTPDGVTSSEKKLLENIQQPSLEEKMLIQEEKKQELLKEIGKKFEVIEKMLEEQDVKHIRELSNGELEEIVNTILRYGVKKSHFRTIQAILNAAQYSPFNISHIDINDFWQREEFKTFITQEIERERKNDNNEEIKPAGSEFFSLIEDFGRRNGPNAYQILEDIFDLMRSELDPMEARAFIATVKYLQAKKMGKK